MQIYFSRQNTTFKQIKLNDTEFKKGESRLKSCISEPLNPKHNYKMFDMFEQHLNNEVELKQLKTGKERKHFATTIYVKFFEILETAKNRNHSFEEFVNNLNRYIDKYQSKKNFEIDSPKLADYNVTSAKNTAAFLQATLEISREEFLEMAKRDQILQNLIGYTLNRDVDNLVKNFNISKEECIQLYKINPKILLHPSVWIIENANKTKEILEIDDSEVFKKIIRENPNILTFEELETSIKKLAEFLDTEEKNIKSIIKTQPVIATMNFELIKSNFYSMKNYLNVDRNTMTEIALVSPSTIREAFAKNRKKYELIASTLRILPETFINKANALPAMYRITPTKLERCIDFITKKLGYSRDEAIDYIAKNLNILSYNFNNMVQRTDDNFNYLSRKLKIDYETYISLLKENAWIMGHRKEALDENFCGIRRFFNILGDKRREMVLKNPQLLTYSTENMIKDVTESAELMNIDIEEYKQMCILEPKLATRAAKYHHLDLPENSDLLRISEYEFIEAGKINPRILTGNSSLISEFKDRLEFSKLTCKDGKQIDLTNPEINEEKTFFEITLASMLASVLGISSVYDKITLQEIIPILKNKLIELKLPEHKLTERFIDFTNTYLESNNIKSKVKIALKKV